MTPATNLSRDLQAVVFDMDGVLVDTEPVWDAVRRGLAVEDQVPWPPEATQAMMGMSTMEWATYLVEHVGVHGTPALVAQRTITGLRQAYRDTLPIKPHAVAAIRRMAAMAPIAVASSSPRVLISTILDVLGVADLFTHIVSSEEVAAGKPAPDVYVEACSRLGANPAFSVAVEDSSNGIRSAHAAGMMVVAVPDEFTQAHPHALRDADVVVDSLAEVNDALVTDLLSRRCSG